MRASPRTGIRGPQRCRRHVRAGDQPSPGRSSCGKIIDKCITNARLRESTMLLDTIKSIGYESPPAPPCPSPSTTCPSRRTSPASSRRPRRRSTRTRSCTSAASPMWSTTTRSSTPGRRSLQKMSKDLKDVRDGAYQPHLADGRLRRPWLLRSVRRRHARPDGRYLRRYHRDPHQVQLP